MGKDAHQWAGELERWLDEPITRASLTRVRAAFDGLVAILEKQPALRDELAPYLCNVFVRTGYLKDFRKLQRFARRVNRPELVAEVEGVLRTELPDVWVRRAIDRGAVQDAIDCWFAVEDHERARLCANELIAACPGRTDILVSARLSVVAYQIGRSSRSRYRRAIAVLKTLRRELDRAGELSTWDLVIEDVLHQFGHRPALMDELRKAGIVADA